MIDFKAGILLMKYLFQLSLKLFSGIIAILLLPQLIQAKEPLNIVVDVWPPYVWLDGNELKGVDVDVTKAVFAELKIPVTLELMPWNRCLVMVENKQADAILDASITSERRNFLYFPDEPVSKGVTVFFKRKGHHIPFSGLNDLEGLKVGAIAGYSYCDEIDSAPFFKQVDRVVTLEQNFKKLLLGRIDVLIEVDSVGYFAAKSLNISNQIDVIPNANYCQSGSYLAFSKKPGHEHLAIQFGQALSKFKNTDNYLKILKKYGLSKAE